MWFGSEGEIQNSSKHSIEKKYFCSIGSFKLPVGTVLDILVIATFLIRTISACQRHTDFRWPWSRCMFIRNGNMAPCQVLVLHRRGSGFTPCHQRNKAVAMTSWMNAFRMERGQHFNLFCEAVPGKLDLRFLPNTKNFINVFKIHSQ